MEGYKSDKDEFRSEVKNIMCEELMSFKNFIIGMIRQSIKEELQLFCKQTQGIALNNVTTNKEDYAAKVKKSRMEKVIVEPIEKQDITETIRQVKNNVDIGKLGLGVEEIDKMHNGKVVIGCTQKKDTHRLADELKKNMGEKYKIKISDKKLPKLKILDIEKDIVLNESDEKIIIMLTNQNDITLNGDTKMEIRKRITKSENNATIIIEVDPKTHKSLIEKQKIKLGWNKCRVFDCVSLLQCYKCCGLYHYAKDCKHDTKCRRCAGNHAEKDCQSLVKKCVNCVKMVKEFKISDIKTDHIANDKDCEYYRRALNKAQKNINYYSE